MRDHPVVALTRHFFASMFAFGVLSEDGADSLKRLGLGALALAISGGLLLTRVFMAKYGSLADAPPEVYARAVVADHAFLMALPMWIVAATLTLASQSLFPDETDFRILMALPLARAEVFAAKLGAFLLFAGLVVAGTHLGLAPLAALTLIPTVATGSFLSAMLAFVGASLAASVFAALSVAAVQGLVVLAGARRRLLAVSGAVRGGLIGGLVLALPLVTRLPATAGAFAAQAWWLPWCPPAWFAGLERWLLGDAVHGRLAAQAAAASILPLGIALVACTTLYRRFDRVTFQPPLRPRDGRKAWRIAWRHGAPVGVAVRRFVSITIRRSVLHQGLVVGLLAAAVGLVANGVLGANWQEPRPDALVADAPAVVLLWAPPTLMFLVVPAIRLTLSVPMDLRANWIFRMTEDVAGRVEIADAGVSAVLAWAVVLPIVLVAPLQWWVLGPSTAALVVVEAAIGALLVEWHMAGWHRVPFTCAYIPGKGFVPQMCVKAFAAYVVFTLAAGIALRASLQRPGIAVMVAVGAAGAVAVARASRRRHARATDLLFAEQVPSELAPLRLNAD